MNRAPLLDRCHTVGNSLGRGRAGVLLLGALLALRASGATAAEIIPADRLADWTPGGTVGVPGGIPKDRTRLIDVTKAPYNADNTGAADAQPAIMQAIAKAAENDVVYLPAGTYRIDKAISVAGGKSKITIRGAGPDKTIITGHHPSGSGIGIVPGDGGDWWYPNRLKLDITGSPRRGATVLTVGDTKGLDGYPHGGIGQLCQLSLKNDPRLPVVAVANFDYMRRQISRIVAKTPTTVTISPGLLFDLPAELAPVLRPVGRYSELVGIEDLTVDGTNSKSPHGLVGIGQSYACWVKNVAARNAERYLFGVDGCLQCEVRRCTIATRKSGFGPNGGGILLGVSSFCRFEDNIIAETFPHMEVNGSSGNVFGYNFCDDGGIQGGLLGCTINSNHCAHCSFNLYEGNVAPKFQSDGYHGSASHDAAFRNWFHGTSTKTDQYWVCVNLNRFTRHYSLAGNVFGRKGVPWLYDNAENGFGYDQHFIYAFGMPNMGNGGFSGGKVQPSKGKYWADWKRLLASGRGKGPGPGGFQEIDLDVKATTLLKGNYNYKDNGVPESESLRGAQLPKSLYLKEKPAWFGDLRWPAFGPDTDFERNKIPAQLRFEARRRADSVPGKTGATNPASARGSAEADWPCFMGPNHNGVVEVGPKLLQSWPANGPKLVWTSGALPGKHSGNGSPIVYDGRVYTYADLELPRAGTKPFSKELLEKLSRLYAGSPDKGKRILEKMAAAQDKEVKTYREYVDALESILGDHVLYNFNPKDAVHNLLVEHGDDVYRDTQVDMLICLDAATGKEL